MFRIIQIVIKHIKFNLNKIRKSIGLALNHSVPEAGQLVNHYRTKIGTSCEQVLVSKNKHIKTYQNKDKQEKQKKEIYFFEFLFRKFAKNIETSNRHKFYELKIGQTKNEFDQNWDYLVGFV
jgi:hypothetical protein